MRIVISKRCTLREKLELLSIRAIFKVSEFLGSTPYAKVLERCLALVLAFVFIFPQHTVPISLLGDIKLLRTVYFDIKEYDNFRLVYC